MRPGWAGDRNSLCHFEIQGGQRQPRAVGLLVFFQTGQEEFMKRWAAIQGESQVLEGGQELPAWATAWKGGGIAELRGGNRFGSNVGGLKLNLATISAETPS